LLHSKQQLRNTFALLSPAINQQHQQQQQQQQRLHPVAVSFADAPSQTQQAGDSSTASAAAVRSPKNNALQEPVSWSQAGHGLALFTDGSSCFRVWAPHATSVTLQVRPASTVNVSGSSRSRYVPALCVEHAAVVVDK
jgi:hypothetical protein